jgi:TRAP-type C4-dicarboxylate transport system permease small subunit
MPNPQRRKADVSGADAEKAATALRDKAAAISSRINWVVERVIALLMALLVADVWLGVVARYVLRVQIPWTEELARYLMIWAALLAISSGIARREHIGFRLLLEKFPAALQKTLLIAFDVAAFAFFAFLFIYGIGMTGTGAKQFAMIFGMSMAIPYASVPVSSLLACIQIILACIRDAGSDGADRGEAETMDGDDEVKMPDEAGAKP